MHRSRSGLACAALLLATACAADTFLDRSLNEWLSDLESGKTAKARRGAAFALGRMGILGGPALAGLARRARDDDDASVRDMAAQAVGEIVRAMPTVPASAWDRAGLVLVKRCIEERDPRALRSVVYALGAFGPAAKGAVPEIREALSHKSPAVRQNAAWALGRVGARLDPASIRAVGERLSDDNPLVRRDAAQALGNLGKEAGRKAVSAAGKELIGMAAREPDAVVRKAALAALASVASRDHDGDAGVLHKLLDDKDAETARAAAFALVAVGGRHLERAMPSLRAALNDDDPDIQAMAAAAFFQLGPEGKVAAADLAAVLTRSPDPKVRRNCIISLGSFKDAAADTVPALAGALKPRKGVTPENQELEEEVRHMAAEALSHIQYPANKAALVAIRDAIASDPNQDVRLRCVEALFQLPDLEESGVAKALLGVLDEKRNDEPAMLVRYNCARVLAKGFGPKAPDKAIDVLLHMLANTRIKVFYETGAKVDGGTTEANKGSTTVAARTGGDARFMAAEALGWMGAKSKENKTVVDSLRKASTDADPMLKDKAKKALDDIGADR